MRKLIVLAVVLAFASGAEATVLTWSADSITMTLGTDAVVQLYADDNQMFSAKSVGNDASSVANIEDIDGPGDIAPVPSYPGWWTITLTDTPPPPPTLMWYVTIRPGSVTGTHELHSDYYGGDDILAITVVPEPATIALLAIGGLGLIRKRRR
ncbi:MAG: PEP-CTERM sorting domain-containing protein [Planctomycetota bacterium]